MSVWKSPILYVGIALVVLVAALLSAPFLINWDSYRASFEDYGRKLTGREVAISGDISARVFPWPRLRLEGVRIANPEGAANPYLVTAEAIEARMLLPSLISGHVEVTDIRVERPVFAFERLESGVGSWWLNPELEAGIPIGAERISVEDLEIVDGKILLSDRRRGGTAVFDDFDATLSSHTLLGPWKARGQLARNGQILSIGITTGKHKSGEPLRFGVKLTPVAGPGLVYSFDGQYSSKGETPVSGTLRVEPFVDESGKANSEAQLKAVLFKAQLSFKEDHALLQDIEIAPADRQQVSNLLTGNAAIELESRISIRADLRAPKFDLDELLGSQGRHLLKSGAVLEGLASAIELLPEGLDGKLTLDVGTLMAGGEKLEGAHLEVELADRGLVVHELKATMPGQTGARFSGLLFASSEKPQLAGDLEIDSANSRELLSWLMPEWKQGIARHWSGARGKLSLKSKVDHGPRSLALTDARFTLDESSATATVILTGGDKALNDITLNIDTLDLDRYLENGVGISNIPAQAFTRIGELNSHAGALGDVRFAMQADKVVLNGVEARDVAAEVVATGDAVDIRAIKIGSVGDARLEIGGVLERGDQANVGTASVRIDAEDPKPLLHLLGFVPPRKVGAPEPLWASELAPMNAILSAQIDNRAAESEVKLTLNGTAGGSSLSIATSYLGDLSDFRAGRLTMAGNINSPTAQKLARLIGLTWRIDDANAAKLSASLEGEVRNGLAIQAELNALGARSQLTGRLNNLLADVPPKLDGTVSLEAQRGDAAFRALGFPNPSAGTALKLTSNVAAEPLHLKLSDLEAWLGDKQVGGQISFRDGKIDAQAEAAELSLPWLMSLVLMPTDGTPITDVTLFTSSPLAGVKGKIAIDAGTMALGSGMVLKNGRAEIEFSDDKLDLSVTGDGARANTFLLKAELKQDASELKVNGMVEGGLELAELLKAPDGEPVIDSLVTFRSSFSGAGRSPAGLAASLSGNGTVSMPSGFVRGIDADSFISGLKFSQTSAGLDRLLRQGFTGSDLIFSGSSGSVTIADGTATLGPIPFEAGGLKGAIKSVVELPSGKIDLGVEVGLKSLNDMPPIEVAYVGPPNRLERSIDASELKARLSASEIRQNMEKLEQLQREQMELFAEENRQAKAETVMEAERQEIQYRSLLNRQRVEQALLKAKAERAETAYRSALELDRNELRRRAEAIDHRRLVEQRRFSQARALEAEADRQDLRLRSVEAERLRQAETAARETAEEERKAREAALEQRRQAEEAARKAEEQRKAQEALERERQRKAEEAARKAEEQRKAQEALERERQRQAEEAARRAEEERRAREEAALALEKKRLAEEAARKAEEERKAREAALALERQHLAEEAARKAEEERKAQEAALVLEKKRLAEEAARKAEEERKAREAALVLERQRLAEEMARKAEEERKAREAALASERQRLAEEVARKAEEERKVQEAALELERKRLAEEAARQIEAERKAQEAALALERQRLAEEAARKAEEERKAQEAALALEKKRLMEQAVRQAEEERRAREAALRLEQELKRAAEAEALKRAAEEAARKQAEEEQKAREKALEIERQRQAEEAERQRQAEEAAHRAVEEKKALVAALMLEQQRLTQEAERRRQQELDRNRQRALRDMNITELMQHLQRTAAWNLSYQRLKELEAQRALEEAQAKIDKLLSESLVDPANPTEAITPARESPALPPPEPLPVEDGDAAGPMVLGGTSDASLADPETMEPQVIVPQGTSKPTLLQRLGLEKVMKSPPANKKQPEIRKRYNFNR
jgi:uncharacterized protein involved in outer membrane biogenesis